MPAELTNELPEPRDSPEAVWWATYNAAVSGAGSNPALVHLGFEGLHDFAVRLADRTHGAMSPRATFEARKSPEVRALVENVQLLLDAYAAHGAQAIDPRIGPLRNALAPFIPTAASSENSP